MDIPCYMSKICSDATLQVHMPCYKSICHDTSPYTMLQNLFVHMPRYRSKTCLYAMLQVHMPCYKSKICLPKSHATSLKYVYTYAMLKFKICLYIMPSYKSKRCLYICHATSLKSVDTYAMLQV